MGRKRAFPWRWRIAALALLAVIAGGGWAWWQAQHWAPPMSEFPVQGVLVGARDGDADFAALHAIGASFVYLEASDGASGRDAAFARNLGRVRGRGLGYGVVHAYDPCIAAEHQAANFVTTVPRDDSLLPPVVALERIAEDCPRMVSDAEVESELTTFLNQVEGHVGKPALLKMSATFQERYGLAARMERGLWLERDWFQPDYAGRPWTLWTANANLRTQAGPMPLRWVVAQP